MAKTDPIKILFHVESLRTLSQDIFSQLLSSEFIKKKIKHISHMEPSYEKESSMQLLSFHSTLYELNKTEPVAHVIFNASFRIHYGITPDGNPFINLTMFKISEKSIRIAYFIPCFETYPDNLASYWENNLLRTMNSYFVECFEQYHPELKIHVHRIGTIEEHPTTIMHQESVTGYEMNA